MHLTTKEGDNFQSLNVWKIKIDDLTAFKIVLQVEANIEINLEAYPHDDKKVFDENDKDRSFRLWSGYPQDVVVYPLTSAAKGDKGYRMRFRWGLFFRAPAFPLFPRVVLRYTRPPTERRPPCRILNCTERCWGCNIRGEFER
jgi:hypothetical protein